MSQDKIQMLLGTGGTCLSSIAGWADTWESTISIVGVAMGLVITILGWLGITPRRLFKRSKGGRSL